MRRGIHGLVVALLLGLVAPMVEAAAQDAGSVPLPVRKVVLYKNGMGYFEHLGTIRDAQAVEITLPSSQLNDVLKSLTVLDLGGGQVTGVTYDSTAPLDRRLKELPIDLRSAGSLVGFLNQITGAGVEVRSPTGTVRGKVMGADVRTRSNGPGSTTQVVEISIFTASGEMRIVELESAGGLRFTEAALVSDIGRYLDLINSENRRDIRRMKIHSTGKGKRDLFVSYTSEVPIWKTTYRVVLDAGKPTLLQGWAIVDNTTSMDWNNVQLSLVAGAPVSFIQNLSQPIYGRRPVVPLPQGVQVSPQTHEGTMDADQYQAFPQSGVVGGVAGGVIGGLEEAEDAKIQLRSRVARKSALAVAEAMNAPAAPAMVLSDAIRQQGVGLRARGAALGEQFEYKLTQPVTIGRNQSALLPILQSDVETEKVSLFNSASGERRPRLAVWLKNTSGLTLDAGAFTVIDSNAFAGEGLMETIQPDERRLLSYALDLGMEITTKWGSEQKRVERVEVNRGVMRIHRKVVEKRTYTIRNNADKARTVVLEHNLRGNWELVETAKPAESSASYYRFKVAAKPKATTEFVVKEESPQETIYSLSNITSQQISLWLRQRDINPAIEKALRPIVAKKAEINELARGKQELEKEQNEIFRDQNRVRDNLNRLGRTPEEARLRQRYVNQMNAQENRLGALRVERDRLEAARAAAQKQLDAMLQNLSFDREL